MWETIRGLVADGCTILLTTSTRRGGPARGPDRRHRPGSQGRRGTSAELKAQVGGSSLRVQLADGADARAASVVAGEVSRHVPVLFPTGTGFSVSLSDANVAADVLIALRQGSLDIVNAASSSPPWTRCSWLLPAMQARRLPLSPRDPQHDHGHEPRPCGEAPGGPDHPHLHTHFRVLARRPRWPGEPCSRCAATRSSSWM